MRRPHAFPKSASTTRPVMLATVVTLLWHAGANLVGWAQPPSVGWDTFSDTWVATDALGRAVPGYETVGPPRADRTVGIFYFLWHGTHIKGGPYDITRILARDPDAMQKKDSPLWGPLHAPHHWGESSFGYYLTDDAGVLRKHAQMLVDAGVDVVIFDVTNQVTYRDYYLALLRVFAEVRHQGNRVPQVAFLCPFWDPAKVVVELHRDLYQPGLYPELWFRWDGKPLILADPDLIGSREGNDQQNTPVELIAGHTLGQTFAVSNALDRVGGRFPTWRSTGSSVTLSLRQGGPDGKRLKVQRYQDVPDNAWLMLAFDPPLAPGVYCLEASEPQGKVGWWSHTDNLVEQGEAFADGKPVAGDRTLRLTTLAPETTRLRRFFTFRRPQPDYFRGQAKPDMWSWLEVHPQHVFTNTAGQKEQMSVGVAQNAVGSRLGSMSEPGARGRSFHDGAQDVRPNAVLHGLNVAEQWARVLREDPRFIFVTGWNEWIAGRFAEFNGIRRPVLFVDQFDQEHSRDIEPMQGGHGDNYYYQMVANIRRYKGARPLPPVQPQPIAIDGQFEDWREVQPEFRDAVGDPVQREHRGWDKTVTYRNRTGRNDLVAAKVSANENTLWFLARTRQPLTSAQDTNWMLLFLDVDANSETGWLGYDFVVNRGPRTPGRTTIERNVGGGYRWAPAGEALWGASGNRLELGVPLTALGLARRPVSIHFKWADNLQQTGEWSDFTLNGDVAPNDRFNYRAVLGPGVLGSR